ncbi:glycosyltransferase family 2 protein [Allobranchiibius sp. CTAmp26]|uniref:glycosyltransferase family 2 protein n=1 Tax=Allobranchiibius sp. CTAmp26 TaxID=2815214 RepID=UPI001AA0F4FE|nr:glycosyltransferase family 2 protein [Allobranchiibius sp. CTAmp26]MBO1756042.1 glycosyltransferase [Allobranchiibius sp. CTAmp26]
MQIHGPVFTVPDAPGWGDAVWIGEVRLDGGGEPTRSEGAVHLTGAEGYHRARLMVRRTGAVLGFVTMDVRDGMVDAGQMASAIDELTDGSGVPADDTFATHPFSVVIATRDRADHLRVALTSLQQQVYGADFEVVVVDNAPRDDATRAVVEGMHADRIRVVTEHRPGTSRARNAGVAAARHEWIAFTDDDVVVDPWWLHNLARGFARGGDDVGCVSGLVPTGELRTESQAWFDRRVGWSKVLLPRVFRMTAPPSDIPFFPFQVGRYGTGANFATARSVVADIGGFDPYLGPGTRSKGGEDLDFFYRVIARGRSLVYEPAAFVWHRHRDTPDALESQAVGYGRGLSAWGAKLLLSPGDLGQGLRALMRREALTLAPFRAYRRPFGDDVAPSVQVGDGRDIGSVERRAFLSGPTSYVGARYFRR